ncbi:MAG: tyrosine-type recombinase/integrase [Dissulfurispiraceae bacterium]
MGLYRRKKKDGSICLVWWMSFVVNGKQVQRSTGTPDQRSAERIYAKVTTEVNEGKWLDKEQGSSKKLRELIAAYTEDYTENKDKNSKSRDKSIFKHLMCYFGEDATLQTVDHLVGKYEAHRLKQTTNRGGSPDSGTIRKELLLLGRMFNIARKQWNWSVANPVHDIELPPNSAKRVRYLGSKDSNPKDPKESVELVKALEKAPQTWLLPFVRIALGTGLREGNLVNLKWSEVNLLTKTITIDAEKMKNDEYLGIPISRTAYDELLGMQQQRGYGEFVFYNDAGKPLNERRVQRAFRAAVAEAAKEAPSLIDFRFHDLRHTYASYLRHGGVALEDIAALLGHKDLRMTKRYAHLNPDSLREPVKVLDNRLLRFYDTAKNDDGKEEGLMAQPLDSAGL